MCCREARRETIRRNPALLRWLSAFPDASTSRWTEPLAFQAPAGLMSRKVLVLHHVPYLREGYYFTPSVRAAAALATARRSPFALPRVVLLSLDELVRQPFLPDGVGAITEVRRRSSATTAS